ncbi:hypothetical protein [Mesorhizobium sp. ANAO-SY3R2]|uniref:hypothetical protein n=1 Tax=Mesorhizobium sp. ANAO-SY3R2 TaxID=3166644 RepID=UPI00366FA280
MDLLFKNELALVPDLGHRLRQLRWFRATYRNSARAVTARYGIRFDIDEKKLTRIFLDWVEIVNAQKSYARLDRADFIVYAAGLALKELIRQAPTRVIATPAAGAAAPELSIPEIVRFWPEGFVHTNFCVCAIAAVFEQEFGTTPELAACADDLRTWWSYRENTAEMPAYAVAYLDRFLGAEPNWLAPDAPEERSAMQRALSVQPKPNAIGHG